MDDNQRQVIRDEETVVAGQPEGSVVQQTSTTSANAPTTPVVAPPAPANRSTVQTTTTGTAPAPSERMVAHNIAESVVDPAADKAAAVDWVNRLIWLIVGVMAALLVIRFGLLAAGANEAAGFSQLIYGLTGWMVAPFKGIFGSPWTYPGTAGTGVLEWEALLAAAVYLLIGWLLTRLVRLAIGTNRTTGTVVHESERSTRV